MTFYPKVLFSYLSKSDGGKSSIFSPTEPGSRAGPGSAINMAVKSLTASGLSLAQSLAFQEVGGGNYTVTGGKKMQTRNASL